jgi:hypothetical protein
LIDVEAVEKREQRDRDRFGVVAVGNLATRLPAADDFGQHAATAGVTAAEVVVGVVLLLEPFGDRDGEEPNQPGCSLIRAADEPSDLLLDRWPNCPLDRVERRRT